MALFETGGVLDRFAVAAAPSLHAGDFREYQSADTGTYFGAAVPPNQINVALVDLSDLGVAPGATIGSITVGLYPVTPSPTGARSSASLTAAASLHADLDPTPNPVDVPCPPAAVLAGVALVGLAGWRRVAVKG